MVRGLHLVGGDGSGLFLTCLLEYCRGEGISQRTLWDGDSPPYPREVYGGEVLEFAGGYGADLLHELASETVTIVDMSGRNRGLLWKWLLYSELLALTIEDGIPVYLWRVGGNLNEFAELPDGVRGVNVTGGDRDIIAGTGGIVLPPILRAVELERLREGRLDWRAALEPASGLPLVTRTRVFHFLKDVLGQIGDTGFFELAKGGELYGRFKGG